MNRGMRLVVVACVALTGFSCTGPVLVCSNPLDASQFGFTMTVPNGYECSYSAASWNISPPAAAIVIWIDQTTEALLSVTVFDLSLGDVPALPSGLTYTPLDDYQTAVATFTINRGVNADQSGDGGVFYIAQANLPGGAYTVRVSYIVEEASDAALATLKTALDGIAQ